MGLMTLRRSLVALLLPLALCSATVHSEDLATCANRAEPLSSYIAAPLLILGEIHGTEETPSLAGAQACALIRSGRKVLLALEIPNDEQDRIDAFLASGGAPADLQNLLAGPHWRRAPEQQDGRSSEAMLRLIQLARQLASKPGTLSLLAFDQWRGDAPRDVSMARNIEAARKRLPGYSTLVLVGNLHAMRSQHTPFDPPVEPMAYHLRAQHARSIDVVPASGQSWFCRDTCGVHDLTRVPVPMAAGADFKLDLSLTPDFDGTLLLRKARASPPAIQRIDGR